MLFCFVTSSCQSETTETEEMDIVNICISSMHETALKISQIREDAILQQTRSEDIEKSTQILVDNFIGDTELCLSTLGFSGEELHQLRSEYGDTAFAFIGVYILNEELGANQTRFWTEEATDCLKEAVGLDVLAAIYEGAAELGWKHLFQKKMLKLALKTSVKYLGTVSSAIFIIGEWSWCISR